MIKHLYIKNYVLIDSLNLDFHDGFSVFIGETGAGKSIFIDAIGLLCADRATTKVVAKGADKAIVEGTFTFEEDSKAMKVLKEAGFDCESEVTFTREITATGKSSVRIDHRIATLSLMKEILQEEIDIHGQRDNAYLLDANYHLELLDAFENNDDLRKEVYQAYKDYEHCLEEKENFLSKQYNPSDLEFFQYQYKEIESLKLQENEEEELLEKEKNIKAFQESYGKLESMMNLYEEEVSGSLYSLYKEAESIRAKGSMESVCTQIEEAYFNLTDAMEELKKNTQTLDLSTEDINALEERLYEIQKIKRKYGNSYEALMLKKEELKNQIDAIENSVSYIAELDKKIEIGKKHYLDKANALSKKRKAGAKELDQVVNRELQDLHLEKARFKTVIEEGQLRSSGIDTVAFYVAMNTGEDFKHLNKTASGGELSRLMLGLKVVFTKLKGIHTIIFDEIDTGVSGAVAFSIGKKMKTLSKDTQVFSVTHLSPVASFANHFYCVSKQEENGKTKTMVNELHQEEIYSSLASLSSGEVNETSLAAAKDLYERAQKA